jgi:hypothetical protein
MGNLKYVIIEALQATSDVYILHCNFKNSALIADCIYVVKLPLSKVNTNGSKLLGTGLPRAEALNWNLCPSSICSTRSNSAVNTIAC